MSRESTVILILTSVPHRHQGQYAVLNWERTVASDDEQFHNVAKDSHSSDSPKVLSFKIQKVVFDLVLSA